VKDQFETISAKQSAAGSHVLGFLPDGRHT
jgi:hypothetical protein